MINQTNYVRVIILLCWLMQLQSCNAQETVVNCTSSNCCDRGYYYDYAAAALVLPGSDAATDLSTYCLPCPVDTYKDTLGMQSCTSCVEPTVTNGVYGATSVDACQPCPAGTYYDSNASELYSYTYTHWCVACEIGFYRSVLADLSCTQCPSGSTTKNSGATSIAECKLLCDGCKHQQYRTGCVAGEKGSCEPCEPCENPAEIRVNCRHDVGFNDAKGECKPTEQLSYTPFCSEKRAITSLNNAGDATLDENYDFAVGLGGFAYSELFGVPNASWVSDFQCREACVAVPDDTSYCGGPYACNTRVCSASFAQDGEDEYRLARACPVAIEDTDDRNSIMRKRRVSCYTCDNCGDVPDADFPELQDWGRGCANECSRLKCDVGEIFDFTDNKCKTCAQLRDIRLCPSSTQAALRTTDVSGNSVLLKRDGCREKPGQFDLQRYNYYETETASPDPHYGDCKECDGQSCEANKYSDTCDTCTACIGHDSRPKEQRTWKLLEDGTDQDLFCQLAQCPRGYTGVHSDGALCVDTCMSEVELACTSSEFVMPCQLPHNTRCRPRWPAPVIVDAEGEAEDMLVPKAVTSYAVDLLGDALDTTSFENALVEIEEESKHRHVCVWNAMDIRDSVARPGGISRTWRKPADSIDMVYGKTGTKFCAPIGSFGSNDDVDYIAWARDATVQDYPLLPLQNTVTESAGSKSQYMLTNTSASVMHYVDVMRDDYIQNSIYYDSVQLPERPASFVGDLFLAMDLKSAVRGDVAYQVSIPVQTSSLLFTAWVRVLAMQDTTRALAEPVVVDVGVDLIGGIGNLAATATQRAWLDMDLVENYSAVEFGTLNVLPAALASSVPVVTVTLQPGVVQAINSESYQLHYLISLFISDSKAHLFFSNAANLTGIHSIVTDGSLDTNANFVRTTTRHSFRTMHGSFVQARHATTCDLVIATEREIYCDEAVEVLFQAPEKTAIVDFVVIRDADDEEAGVVVTVEQRSNIDVHVLSLFGVSTAARNTDKTTALSLGSPITVAAQDDRIIVVSKSSGLNNIRISMYNVAGLLVQNVETSSTSSTPAPTTSSSNLNAPLTLIRYTEVTLSSVSAVSADAAQLDLRIRSAALIGQGYTLGVIAIGLIDALMLADLHGNTVTVAVDTDTSKPVCKPSLGWLDASATEDTVEQRFIVGVPCLGLLWRGRSSATGMQLRPMLRSNNMLRAAHFFRVESQSGTQWWRFGVFTAADLPAQTSTSACADGYGSERNEVLLYTESLIQDYWSCSWLCTQDATCKAYNDNGACYHYSGSTADGQLSIHCPKKPVSEPAKTMQLLQSEQRFMTTVRNFQKLSTVQNFRQSVLNQQVEYATAILYIPPTFNVNDMKDVKDLDDKPEPTPENRMIACSRVGSFKSNHKRFASIAQAMQEAISEISENRSTTLTFPQFTDAAGGIHVYHIQMTFPEAFSQNIYMVRQYVARNSAVYPQGYVVRVVEEPPLPFSLIMTLESSDVIIALFNHPTVDVSLPTYKAYKAIEGYRAAAFTPTPNTPIEFKEKSSQWHRVSALVSAAQASQISRVQLHATRREDVTNSDWAAEDCDTQLVVGVDALSMLPLVSEVPAYEFAADKLVVGIRVPDSNPLPDEFLEVLSGDDTTNWERLHVRALVLGDFSDLDVLCQSTVRVRQRMSYPIFDDGSYTLNSNLHSLGCTIHPGLDECFFELPLKLAHASVLAVEFAFSDASCAPALDQLFVTLAPPHSTQYECPLLVQYWNADEQACEGCAGTSTPCIAGSYRPGCEALEFDKSDTAACVSCLTTNFDIPSTASEFTDAYEWSDAGTCMVDCKPGYTKNPDGNCVACKSVTCDVGNETITCTTDVDTHCRPCEIPLEHGVFSVNERFTTPDSCETECVEDHYRASFRSSAADDADRCQAGDTGLCNYSPCVPCSTLDEVRAVLALTERPPGEFYEFVPCTGTSDLFHSLCGDITNAERDFLESATADASDVGTPCMYECPAGRYYHESALTHSITFTTDQQPLESQLDGSHAVEELTDVYTDMKTAFCKQCPVPWASADPLTYTWLPETADKQCPFECKAEYDFLRDTCQSCPDDCAFDQYPGGDPDDTENPACTCQACDTEGFPLLNWTWHTAGTLGDPTSCQGTCDGGFFRSGARCLAHSSRPAAGCGVDHFWHAGSDLFDASCLPCRSCEGQSEISACTADADAICTLCVSSIDSNSERFVGTLCDVVCKDGFIRNTQTGGSGDCEHCNFFECAPGTKLRSYPTHCKDCAACATHLPQYSHWVYQCEYACNVGYMPMTVTHVHEDDSETQQEQCVVEKSGLFMAHANVAERKNVRCTGAEFLGPDYTCKPCTVSTPPLSQLHSTWSWLPKSCQWECKADRLLYSDIINAKHCLTWQAFQATVVARQNTFNVRFSVIQHVVPRLSMHEILCCMLVLSVCVSLQVWF